MKQQRRVLPFFTALLLALLLAGCNGGIGEIVQQLGSLFAPAPAAAPAAPEDIAADTSEESGDQEVDEGVSAVENGEATGDEVGVYFVTPGDGDVVTSPFVVEMGAVGLEVEAAGEIREGAGHMHILVNTDFVPAGELIIADAQHLHYGQGQTEVELALEPGEYTLRLQFADGAHITLEGDEYRDEITITVVE